MGIVTFLLRSLIARKHDFALATHPYIYTHQDGLSLSPVAISALDQRDFLGRYRIHHHLAMCSDKEDLGPYNPKG